MTIDPNRLMYNADDIRSIVIRARMLGLDRARILASLTPGSSGRRLGSLTDIEIRRILDEAWRVTEPKTRNDP